MTAHPPAPGNKGEKKDLIPQEKKKKKKKTMECVKKCSLMGRYLWNFRARKIRKKRKKYHASFIPIEYLHLGQQTLLT